MTMPNDVESPMYVTASQEVRESDAALGDEEVAGAAAVVGGAAGASSVESLISPAGAFSEGGGNPLPSAPIAPARPAPSNARTLSATTAAAPAATRCRRRR